MSASTFSFPTTTLFGAGALAELPDRLATLNIQRPLVVTDHGLLATEAFQKLQQALEPSQQNRGWFLHHGVHPNPVESDVRETAEAYRTNQCDAVIALGGGSALGKSTAVAQSDSEARGINA